MTSKAQDSGGNLSPLLPVEIGRLIYTYLGIINCHKTQACFIEEDANLKELNVLVEKKLLRNIEMDLNNYNLEDVLKEYILMKYGIDKLCRTFVSETVSTQNLGSIQKLKRLSDKFTTITSSQETRTQPSSRSFQRMNTQRKAMTDEERRISDLRAQSVIDRYKTTIRPKKPKPVEDLQEVAGSQKMPDLLTLQPISPRHLGVNIESPMKTGHELPDYVAKMIRSRQTLDDGSKRNFQIRSSLEKLASTPVQKTPAALAETGLVSSTTNHQHGSLVVTHTDSKDGQQVLDTSVVESEDGRSIVAAHVLVSMSGTAANSTKSSSSRDTSRQMTSSSTASRSTNISTCAINLPSVARHSDSTTAKVSEHIEPPGSPFKSRKSALKTRVPVKHKLSSMPILTFNDEEEEVKKKIEAFTQSSNEDLMNHFVAQPLVTILAETHDVDQAVEHFLSNSEIFQSFNQVLEEFSAHESTMNGTPTKQYCQAVITTPIETALPQDTITLSGEKSSAVIMSETVTLRYDLTEGKTSGVSTAKPVDVPSGSGCSESKKFNISASDTNLAKKYPKKRQKEFTGNRSGNNDSVPEQKYVAGLSISFNAVLNSEVNDLILVNHLDNVSRKSTLQMVEDFLIADIQTLPPATDMNQISVFNEPHDFFCEAEPDVIHEPVSETKQEEKALDDLKVSNTYKKNLSTPTKMTSPSKMILRSDKSSQSFSPNFTARPKRCDSTVTQRERDNNSFLRTPQFSKDSCGRSETTSDLPTSFLNVLDRQSSPSKKSRKLRTPEKFSKVLEKSRMLGLNDLKSPSKTVTPVKAVALNVDVTPPVLQQEESLITPPSECYDDTNTPAIRVARYSENSTPVKASLPTSFKNVLSTQESKSPRKTPSKKNFLPKNNVATSFAPIEEEDSLITPPSERYAPKNVDESDDGTACETPHKQRGPAHPEEHVLCTPLKALREAVKLATPSPVKPGFAFQSKNVPTTPGKWYQQQGGSNFQQTNTPLKRVGTSEAVFTPSPCRRPPTTPAKWYTPPHAKPTPLKGLDEALSRMAQCSPQIFQSPCKTFDSPSKSLGNSQYATPSKSFDRAQPIYGSPTKTPSKSFGTSQYVPITGSSGKSSKQTTTKSIATTSNSLGTPGKLILVGSPMKRLEKSSHLTISSPVKSVAEVAKKLFEEGETKTRNFVFISPSKRVPRKVPLVKIAERSEKLESSELCSKWESSHDVNNLDNYRTIHQVVEETEVLKSPPASKKRRHSSSDPEIRIVKKPRKSTTHKNVDKRRTTQQTQKLSYNLDVNLEIVPQWASIHKTISKEYVGKVSEKTASDSKQMSLPVALGLVPRLRPYSGAKKLTIENKTGNQNTTDGKQMSVQSKMIQTTTGPQNFFENKFGLTLSKMEMYYIQDSRKRSSKRK